MSLNHEKLNVYKFSIQFAAWAYEFSEELKGSNRNMKDQLVRASQSISLNIAEGNAKRTKPDRRRYFEIARGSALECAAILDILVVVGVLSKDECCDQKGILDQIAAMLTSLGGKGFKGS